MEIEKKVDALGSAFEAFKKANDETLAELQKKGTVDPLLAAKADKANEAVQKLQDEVKAMQTAMNRSGGKSDEELQGEKAKLEAKSFNRYLRKGLSSMSAEETKALSVDSDPDGGYLVTAQMSSEVVKKVFESSPIRQLADVMTISTDALEIIEDLDEAGSGWVGETEPRLETSTPQIKKLTIPVHELSASPKATQKILDDAAFNMEAWLTGKIAEKFSRDEATAFVLGNGVGKPTGFMAYAAGTGFNQIEQVNSGSAATITADGLIDLFYALKSSYRANAKFLMNRATVKIARKFKDVTSGQYLWQPGLNGSAQDTILGAQVFEANDLALVGANLLSVAFGDFKQGYQIVDRVGIRVLRDPYSSKPYVIFYSTKRVGGAVKNFEAIKIGKCSA